MPPIQEDVRYIVSKFLQKMKDSINCDGPEYNLPFKIASFHILVSPIHCRCICHAFWHDYTVNLEI